MAIIKCKMCGGDIEISADKTFGTCEYCGSTMTLPKTDDDQRLSLFNRGTHLRRNGEFDKAAAIYERLIGENDADAEAHWNLLLCRYGIEYVQDPASGERIPTCHRASFDSILNDVDYQAALKYSDGVARSLYEKEALRIANLQKDILAISQKETPFDVFICYKESDENGKRTKDSALAQDIYYQLTDVGYKVFFARITLEDKLGQEYEPYIFAALHSAKVMVVVGTKPEYLNAVWVKNEWSRYLALMRTDRSRLLIPCYRDMDPYDMPEELSMLQSQDMGKIGFIQDLIRGVKKVVDATKPQEAVTETVKETVVVHNEGGSNVQALLKRGNMALEDGEWTKADEFFEQVLNQDAECGEAYLGKFLAKAKSPSAQKYAASYIEQVKNAAPTEKDEEACEEDEAFISDCIKRYQVQGILLVEDIRKQLEFDRSYCVASDYYAEAANETRNQFAADKDLTRAAKYASAEARSISDGIPQALEALRRDAQQRETAERTTLTENYRDFLTETKNRLEKEHPQRLKEAEEAEKAEIYRQRKAKAAAKKAGIVAGIAAAVIALALIVTKVMIPASRYSKAVQFRDEGNYDAAIAGFTVLGYYKDSPTQLFETRKLKEESEQAAKLARAYANAETMLENGEYDAAITAFSALGTYSDAADRLNNAKAKKQEADNAALYAEAVAMQKSGNYDEAISAFTTLGAYEDAADRRKECQYSQADQLQKDGETAKAAIAFGKLGDYLDSSERSGSLWEQIADRTTILAGNTHTVGLRVDGTVVAVGDNSEELCNVSDWSNIVAIAGDFSHTVGLRSDGTVVATGNNAAGQCNVSDWTNVVAIVAGHSCTIGLKTDGTVIAVGLNSNGRCDVSSWTDIVAIATGYDHTIGLKSDGTVVAVGSNEKGQCDVSNWKNIQSVIANDYNTYGLKSDGTVVAVGWNVEGECNVSAWTDIVTIAADGSSIIGLKSDGTPVTAGSNRYGQRDVSNWVNIADVTTNGFNTIGLKADGSAIAAGDTREGKCNVSDWSNITATALGLCHTVGLKDDGTVVAVGWNEYGQCDVSGWTDIKLPNK